MPARNYGYGFEIAPELEALLAGCQSKRSGSLVFCWIRDSEHGCRFKLKDVENIKRCAVKVSPVAHRSLLCYMRFRLLAAL